MLMQKFLNRKKGKDYWVATAENDEELSYLLTKSTGDSAHWKPSFMGRNKANKFYTYDEDASAEAIIRFRTDPTFPQVEPVALIDPVTITNVIPQEGADVSKEEAKEMTMEELRKAAAQKAKAEGKPTTELRTKWSKEQLAEYVANGIWPQAQVNAAPAPDMNALGAMMAQMIAQFMSAPGIDAEAVREIVQEEIGAARRSFTVIIPERDAVNVDTQHEKFPTLCKLVAARENFMLVGPAGSGKTHAISKAAEVMGLFFHCISVGQQTTKTDLLGFKDANGTYHRTALREAVEHGGVFLLDEADAGNANTLTVLNAMTSNHFAAFPDATIPVHPDFVCVCAMNTYGRGADRQYVGRNQLDAASLDRFVVIDFDYDEELERLLTRNDDWCSTVQSYRKAAFELKERIVISPRASYKGAKLLAAGFTKAEVEEMAVWKGVSYDIQTKIKNSARYHLSSVVNG